MIYNSELNIVNELARVFRQYSQFDEEQECMDKVRSLNRKIYRERNKFWGWLVSPFRWYFEKLIGSLPRFLTAIIVWPAFFTPLNYFFMPTNTSDRMLKAIGYAINSFFGMELPTIDSSTSMPLLILNIFAIMMGFFHLGIFISQLYSVVSRK